MKIAIAQTKSLKGNIEKNIENHLQIIEKAIALKADLIIFPELSITNYEPTLASQLATTIDDSIFDCFQQLSTKNEITIGIGMPTKELEGIKISMLIFQPNQKRTVYSKQQLHVDELPYFVCGNMPMFLKIKGQKIAIGICYETLQTAPFLQAQQNNADIYIASVAKSQSGIQKANLHFPKMATTFKIPILMANSVGCCDNFLSVGQSSVWNDRGEVIGKLDNQHQGILIFDMEHLSTGQNNI